MIRTKMIAAFKSLADRATASIPVALKGDFLALRGHFGFEESGHFSSSMIIDNLTENINAALKPEKNEEQLKRKDLIDLIAALVYESVLEGLDNTVYLTLLQIVTSKEPVYKPFSETEAWLLALSQAKDYELFSPDTYGAGLLSLRDRFTKAYDIGIAANELRKRGCEVVISGTTLEFKSGLEAIVAGVEVLIIDYGPVNFISAIFTFLVRQGIYVAEYRRYLIKNEISFLSSQAYPMLPFGFLLNLAVKHIGKAEVQLKQAKANALMAEIEKIAKFLGRIADARAYSIWEIQHQHADGLLDTIRSFALFDANFAFPCSDILDIIDFMEHLFTWQAEEAFTGLYGFSKKDIIAVTKVIDQLTADNGPQVIYTSAVHKQLKYLEVAKLADILGYLSHEPGHINQDFVLTEHYDKCDFGAKPLIRLSPTKFLLCDKSWCAAAFYEVLAMLVRRLDTKDNESNKKIGPAIEHFVYHKFNEKGITILNGNYSRTTPVKGEADGVVETNSAIILFEIKKKVLTRRSKTGSAVALIIDLAGSLLEAQVQAGRTELLLRQEGYVELESAGKTNRINFNDREIERVALTQWDFGSFQDRSMINNVSSV